MKIKFTKMHGCGNDYIYINGYNNVIENPSKFAISVSNRHFGIGSDGLVLILPSYKADATMKMFNADGSEGKMCGNAIRCVGKYLYDTKLIDKKDISIETLSGIKHLQLKMLGNNISSIRVSMGEYSLDPKTLPVITKKAKLIDEVITVLGKKVNITCVSMGNPHSVIFVDDVGVLNLSEIGPVFENLDIFPERVNTEFVEIINETTVKMRVWERGSGETLACGTGACAVAVACVLKGIFKEDVDNTIKLLGGDLVINVSKDKQVYMEGPATTVFEGEI